MLANWLPFAKTHRGVTTIRRGRGPNQQPSPPPLLPYRRRSHGEESVILDESMVPDGLISCEATGAVPLIVTGAEQRGTTSGGSFPQAGDCWRKKVTSNRQKRETR